LARAPRFAGLLGFFALAFPSFISKWGLGGALNRLPRTRLNSGFFVGSDLAMSYQIPFIDPHKKLEWAEQHINDLRVQTNKFFSDHYKLVFVREMQNGQCAITIERQSPIPKEFSLIIGDAVHNLRAALDLLAFHLVANSGKQFNESAIHFPILKKGNDPNALKSAIQGACIHFAGAAILNHFQTFQAYKGGHLDLWELNEVDIIDKHRLLLTTADLLEVPSLTLKDFDRFAPSISFKNVSFGGMRHVAIWPSYLPSWARFPLPPHKKDLGGTFTILFKEGPFSGKPVLIVLDRLANNVRSIVESTEALFAP
jgi:hypothetical protein